MADATTLPEGVTLVDSFPFDSNPNLITDVNGYLRGDRSVDAWTMQDTFAQFFTDGVFGTPANALQISKASTGLAVVIQPGMFVIHGGMGGIKDKSGPLTLTLDTAAAAGNVCYGIMLRYDNNANMRSLGFRVVKGTAGATPQPPEPDQTSENVMEYRLGYVTVQNGATDLSNATVTNEKGSYLCPYAAPFVPLDLSAITDDAKEQAQEATDAFLLYAQKYYDLVASALDGTTAGELEERINAITPANFVDNVTLSQTSAGKMQVKDSGISTAKIQDGAVTKDKLDSYFDFITEPSDAGSVLMGGQTPTWGTLRNIFDFDSVTQLWSGTWSTGTITVPGINDYSLIRVTMDSREGGTSLAVAYAFNFGGFFSGISAQSISGGSVSNRYFSYPMFGFSSNDAGVLTPEVDIIGYPSSSDKNTYSAICIQFSYSVSGDLGGGIARVRKIEGVLK